MFCSVSSSIGRKCPLTLNENRTSDMCVFTVDTIQKGGKTTDVSAAECVRQRHLLWLTLMLHFETNKQVITGKAIDDLTVIACLPVLKYNINVNHICQYN